MLKLPFLMDLWIMWIPYKEPLSFFLCISFGFLEIIQDIIIAIPPIIEGIKIGS